MEYPSESRSGCITEPYTAKIVRRPVRPLRPGEVLIRVRAAAICGSDLHIYKGKHPSVPLPASIGHEFSGDVAAVCDPENEKWLGKRVTAEPCSFCGVCPACRKGRYDLCEKLSFIYRNGDNALADYIAVSAGSLYELPDSLGYEAGALIEPLSVSLHAVRQAEVKAGDTVLVIGDGAIGILTAAACRRAGAERVLIAGHSERRLAIAREMGATDMFDSHKGETVEWVRELTGSVEKSFECVGNSTCFSQALSVLNRGGTAVVTGIYEDTKVTFDIAGLVSRQLTVRGAQGYCGDFPDAIRMARELPLEKLISHTFGLDGLPDAMRTAADRSSGSLKVVLNV